MQHHRKQNHAESRAKRVRRGQSRLKNVVSLRISDQEKQILEGISQARSLNVSEVVREAITFWLSAREGVPATHGSSH